MDINDTEIDFPFTHIYSAFDQSPAIKPSEGPTPLLFPELWSLIFSMVCKNVHQLNDITMLCKGIRHYCWTSPAAKAHFFLSKYGSDQALCVAARSG
ncbi:hypothetical protein HDV05_002860, partial [Chytridiales sp. JEL 0842]